MSGGTRTACEQSGEPGGFGPRASIIAPYWTNRLYRPEDTDSVFELIRAVHGDERPGLNRAYWNWRYRNGTSFQAEVILAEFEGRPIGIQPVALFDFQWGDRRLKGAVYTGVMTHR